MKLIKSNNKTLELTIEKIVPNGYGLGFTEGLTVFVSLAAAGDELRVRISQMKGKVAFAEIVEIIKPSTDRIKPPCVYFGRCGGCDFQHLNYEAQLNAKIGIIKDCLKRIGKLDFQNIKIIGSPKEFGYRARAAWHADTRSRKVGYFRRASHSIIDVETCPILTDELQNTLEELRGTIEWESFWSEKIEIEAANVGEDVSVYSSELIEPTQELMFAVLGEKYFYDATAFFQGNPFLIESLIDTALRDASGKFALDLYCGVGLFTLPLARKFEKVVGIESGEKAVEFARKNIEHARIENAEVFAENVGEWLAENDAKPDFILLDPPRVGTEKEVIEHILRIAPNKIAYVSCEPSTLSRDLRILCENVYEIQSITAIDLFPQTHHIETIVRLKKS